MTQVEVPKKNHLRAFWGKDCCRSYSYVTDENGGGKVMTLELTSALIEC